MFLKEWARRNQVWKRRQTGSGPVGNEVPMDIKVSSPLATSSIGLDHTDNWLFSVMTAIDQCYTRAIGLSLFQVIMNKVNLLKASLISWKRLKCHSSLQACSSGVRPRSAFEGQPKLPTECHIYRGIITRISWWQSLSCGCFLSTIFLYVCFADLQLPY